MARTLVAKNSSLCSFFKTALGAGSAQPLIFPRGVNRLIVSSPTATVAALQWRADGIVTIFPTDGGSPANFAELGSGVRLVGGNSPPAIIEVETPSSTWNIRNLSGIALGLYIEGHVIGGAE